MFHVKHSDQDTIAAIATPIGVGGIGVIRISGLKAEEILNKLFLPSSGEAIRSHQMQSGWLLDPLTSSHVDQIMACYMRGPKSYTGEDVVELYCHGGPFLLNVALRLALQLSCRLAERGEFTKRAFLNRKLDLLQAEAVLDLIKAPTEKSAGYAVGQLEGRLSNLVKGMREKLLNILAAVEADIDFDGDIDGLVFGEIIGKIEGVADELKALISTADFGHIVREGAAVVIVGRPNVGKSSLLNAVLGAERALVAEESGTTRDVIMESLNLNGLPLKIIDTAGLVDAGTVVEQLGVRRAGQEIEAADIIVMVVDGSLPLSVEDEKVVARVKEKKGLVVINKKDLSLQLDSSELGKRLPGWPIYETSALKGEGVPRLLEAIYCFATTRLLAPVGSAVLINQRHKERLESALSCVIMAYEALEKKGSIDLGAIDIKEALVALGEIDGSQVAEEVVNKIFDKFCVGK